MAWTAPLVAKAETEARAVPAQLTADLPPAVLSAEQVALVEDLWARPGRFWGVRRRRNMPVELESWAMTREAFYRLLRIARGLAKAQSAGRYRLRMQEHFTAYTSDFNAISALAFVGAWRL